MALHYLEDEGAVDDGGEGPGQAGQPTALLRALVQRGVVREVLQAEGGEDGEQRGGGEGDEEGHFECGLVIWPTHPKPMRQGFVLPGYSETISETVAPADGRCLT